MCDVGWMNIHYSLKYPYNTTNELRVPPCNHQLCTHTFFTLLARTIVHMSIPQISLSHVCVCMWRCVFTNVYHPSLEAWNTDAFFIARILQDCVRTRVYVPNYTSCSSTVLYPHPIPPDNDNTTFISHIHIPIPIHLIEPVLDSKRTLPRNTFNLWKIPFLIAKRTNTPRPQPALDTI